MLIVAVKINVYFGDVFFDGPVFIKSGVTLSGKYSDDLGWTSFILYEGPNNGNTDEDALIVIDGVTGAQVDHIYFQQKSMPAGDVVPGTLGNICMDVRNSKVNIKETRRKLFRLLYVCFGFIY